MNSEPNSDNVANSLQSSNEFSKSETSTAILPDAAALHSSALTSEGIDTLANQPSLSVEEIEEKRRLRKEAKAARKAQQLEMRLEFRKQNRKQEKLKRKENKRSRAAALASEFPDRPKREKVVQIQTNLDVVIDLDFEGIITTDNSKNPVLF
ncbi:hypothetical protein HK096_007624 [Nowakowskiella sp. JEL0078]|nr:hypothetical protein HK096_007624 [Nowakowskiella sp. JEL0078]